MKNSVGMEMIELKPATFAMGSENGEWDESPVHEVTIGTPFRMSSTEVTNAQYEQFDPEHRKFRGRRGISNADDEAVVFVSWYDAMRFCEWLSEKEGQPYRLPTEAEWEFACRAGAVTRYSTGDELPEDFHKHQRQDWEPQPVEIFVGRTPPNAWGLYDMHGNVEEWCYDWYGPYLAQSQVDPIGRDDGEIKVTRGGSHNTTVEYLRSANRSGTIPEDRHWLIGFRVVQGALPDTEPIPAPEPELWAQNVSQEDYDWSNGLDADAPYFKGPITYVHIPPNSNGPLYSEHNHQPALTWLPNGDLLAIWYTTTSEKSRKLAVAASRLRAGSEIWEPARLFWDAPDRNDHGSSLMWDGKNTLYHFNGLGTDGTWGKLALIYRTSHDYGATWSKAKLAQPEHELRHQVIQGSFVTQEGYIVVPCDAVTGGSGGTAVNISRDNGKSWYDPGEGRPVPEFKEGTSGAWIAGIHAAVRQLEDGRLMAYGRGNNINGKMPKSISSDMGENWKYSASEFPPIGGGQRPVLLRLKEGPLFFASFAEAIVQRDEEGNERRGSGLFGALSYDEGQSWPVKKLITPGDPSRKVDGGGNTGIFTLSATTAEPRGYLAATQTPDGSIHLIGSKQYYAFNIAWLKNPPSAFLPLNNSNR